MAIKIAICDDALHICSDLESKLIDILKKKKLEYDIETFRTGEGLCDALKRQHFDLIFLDIDLPECGGIKVGKYIRETLKNYIVKIAYISENDIYVRELCEFVPIGYLTKKVEEERVIKIIERYFMVTEQENQVFRYRKRAKEYTIPYSEIMYLESNGHRVSIYTIDKKDMFYDTIENVYKQLKHNNFLHIHKSFIVNYRFVKDYYYKEVEVVNGKKLSISRAKQKEIYSKYMQLRKRDE